MTPKRYKENIFGLVPDIFNQGFVLMEVIVSLLIIGIALSVILRSFNTCADSNIRTQIATTALFLAQKALFDVDFNSDNYKKGASEGNFGEEYPNFYWSVTAYEYEPQYDDVTLKNDIKEIEKMKEYKIDIIYNDQKGRYFIPITLKTAFLGTERFSFQSLQSQMKQR